MEESPAEQKTAVIIGAGPAGLTAAYELLTRTGIRPVVLEQSLQVGGISRTVDFKGNKIDIGGHRFFSKSSRVTAWWQKMLPLQGPAADTDGLPVSPHGMDPEQHDKVMLVRRRLSRIYFLGKFLAYPLDLSRELLEHLGWRRTLRMGTDYLIARLRPVHPEKSLEDFLKNRFGNHLYQTFFSDYTEKLWGVPCSEINPEWGAQRIKGLSLRKAVSHALSKRDSISGGKEVETSLIDHFHYPKFGPGQMWEHVAQEIERLGGRIMLGTCVTDVTYHNSRASHVVATGSDGQSVEFPNPDWVMSSMPIKELFQHAHPDVPPGITAAAGGLRYRDFITVGILCERQESTLGRMKDNWLYIQEPRVKLGRVQIFNNWSPYLVADHSRIWLGLEYFASEGDAFWSLPDKEIDRIARKELSAIGLADEVDMVDSVVIRQPKAYPAYFGTYNRIDEIREFVDRIDNLFLIGRNGMHRYNNQDHSMLSAMTAVDIILDPERSKDGIWSVNTETEYHESRSRG